MNNTRLAILGLGVLLVFLLLGTCSTAFNPPSDVTAEQMHVINTQVHSLHEEIVAARRPDTWSMLVFAASVLVPVALAVLLLYQADRSAVGRDEIFHYAVQHRLTPEMLHAALELQQLKKSETRSDRTARQIRLVKRWRERRRALPSRKNKTPDDEENDSWKPFRPRPTLAC